MQGTADDCPLGCTLYTPDGQRYVVPAVLLRAENNAELRAKHSDVHATLGFDQDGVVYTKTGPLDVCRWFARRVVVGVGGREDVVCANVMRREGRFEPGETYFVLRGARPFEIANCSRVGGVLCDDCVLVACAGNHVLFYDVESGSEVCRRDVHGDGWLARLTVSADGSTMVFCKEILHLFRRTHGDYEVEPGATIEVYDVQTWEPRWTVTSPRYVCQLSISADGGTLGYVEVDESGGPSHPWAVVVCQSTNVVVCTAPAGEEALRIKCADGTVAKVQLSADGSAVVVVESVRPMYECVSSTVCVYSVATGEALRRFEHADMPVKFAKLSADGRVLLVAKQGPNQDEPGRLHICSVATGETLRSYTQPEALYFAAVDLSADGTTVAFAECSHRSRDRGRNRVVVWDVDGATHDTAQGCQVSACMLSADASVLVTAEIMPTAETGDSGECTRFVIRRGPFRLHV